MAPVEANAAVGIVLDDEEIVLVGELDQPTAAFRSHGDTAGILEVGNDVGELEPRVAFSNALELFLEKVHAHAIFVHLDGVDIRFIG